MPRSVNQHLKLAAKLVIVAVIFAVLYQRGFISLQHTFSALSHYEFMIPAVCLLSATVLIEYVRWHTLLRVQSFCIPFKKTCELGLIGAFFSIALPGSMTGDVVKAYYLAKLSPGRSAHALSTIVLDRAIGFTALVLLAAGGLALSNSQDAENIVPDAVRIVTYLLSLVIVLFWAHMLFIKNEQDAILKLLRWTGGKNRALSFVASFYEGVRIVQSARAAAAVAFGLSLIAYFLLAIVCYLFASALGETHIYLTDVLFAVPVGLAVASIPLMPAGIGSGHLAFTLLFQLMGSMRGADLFTLVVLFQMVLGGIGGIAFVRFRAADSRGGNTTKSEPTA